jgi:UDP-N-acetylmuramate dehydrogenase
MFSGGELNLSYRHSVYSGGGYVITGAVFKLQKGDKSEITAKMNGFMNRRKEKQPLDKPSAGSTFKRPAKGYASAMIDGCGLKGMRVGGAVVSEKHAGFVVNTGGATCADVVSLIEKIKAEVMRQKGVELHCEVKVIV